MHSKISEELPLVTIRCLVYNQGAYIRQCLEGFVMQKTNFKFEAIVHDDASTDNSAEIIREFANKYPDIIKPIIEEENQYSKHDGSLKRIVNQNLRGKYVALCEGDDYWTDPYKLQKEVDFLEGNPDYGLVYTNVDFYNESSKTFERCYLNNGKIPRSYNFRDHLIKQCYIAPCTWLLRKEFLLKDMKTGYVDGTFPLALDIWATSNIHYIDEVTTVYRVLEESASHSKLLSKRFRFSTGLFRIQKDYIEKYKNLLSDKDITYIYSNHYRKNLPMAIALNNLDFIKEAKKMLRNNFDIISFVMIYFRKILLLRNIFSLIYNMKGFKIE